MILNFKTKKSYNEYVQKIKSYLEQLLKSHYYAFRDSKFTDTLNNRVCFVFNHSDTSKHNIREGYFYPYDSIKDANNTLMKGGKDTIKFVDNIKSLEYYHSILTNKDTIFINELDKLK